MRHRRSSVLDEPTFHIEDDDGGTDADGDPCDRCDCIRSKHEGGKGPCDCGRCKKYVDPFG